MPDFSSVGKILMVIGGSLVVFGLLLNMGDRLFGLGRLPGDIFIQRGSFIFYFPLVTCIIISIVISVLIRLFKP